MRSIIAGGSLVVLLLALGCKSLTPYHRDLPSDGGVAGTATPTVENLVGYLNSNAQRLQPTQAITCTNVTIDVTADGQKVGVSGRMMCQGPRNFLLSGMVLGHPAVDIGSNNKEFWFWSREMRAQDNQAYLYHCSYDDLSRGTRVPFPFQPEMVVSALGLAQYDATKPSYKVDINKDDKGYRTILLTEEARSPENKPIRKITVFDYNTQTPPYPQVLAHILKDEQGRVVCAANIRRAQKLGANGPIIPQIIDFSWPEQKLKMTMQIHSPNIVAMPPEKAAQRFTRENLQYPSYNLAAQAPDGVGVQRAGATTPIYRR